MAKGSASVGCALHVGLRCGCVTQHWAAHRTTACAGLFMGPHGAILCKTHMVPPWVVRVPRVHVNLLAWWQHRGDATGTYNVI
jgi:hypothetical protein